jgi:hypothetical protein
MSNQNGGSKSTHFADRLEGQDQALNLATTALHESGADNAYRLLGQSTVAHSKMMVRTDGAPVFDFWLESMNAREVPRDLPGQEGGACNEGTHDVYGHLLPADLTKLSHRSTHYNLEDELFERSGSMRGLVQIDAAAFIERFDLTGLLGHPAGYKGYDQGGLLSEVRPGVTDFVFLDEAEHEGKR